MGQGTCGLNIICNVRFSPTNALRALDFCRRWYAITKGEKYVKRFNAVLVDSFNRAGDTRIPFCPAVCTRVESSPVAAPHSRDLLVYIESWSVVVFRKRTLCTAIGSNTPL